MNFDELIGIPYVFRGRDPEVGLDCLGLVVEAFKCAGASFPDPIEYQENWVEYGNDHLRENRPESWRPVEEPYEPLDVIFLRMNREKVPSHIGLHVGDGRVLHMPTGGKSCLIRLRGVRRFIESAWRLPEFT